MAKRRLEDSEEEPDSLGIKSGDKHKEDDEIAVVDADKAVHSTFSLVETTEIASDDQSRSGEEGTGKANKAQLVVEGDQIHDDSEERDAEMPSSCENILLKGGEKTAGQLCDVSKQHRLDSGTIGMSRRIEIPVNKVGVLIGKFGHMIQYIIKFSRAEIRFIRDADGDRWSKSRVVELVGTLESLNKAERMIKDVITEAGARGSPSLVARSSDAVNAAAESVEIQIPVPSNKVGFIVGKGGETIRNLQTRSGALFQTIRQSVNGDQFRVKKVKVTGDLRQVNMASKLIKKVMNQADVGGSPSIVARGFDAATAESIEFAISVPRDKVGGVKECTSESYDFINLSFDVDRGDEFLNATVAVVDGCRKMDKYCNKDELTFLSDPSGLVDYRIPTDFCSNCLESACLDNQCHSVGINEHGFFCAAIIASRRITEANLLAISLGTIRGVCPPPRIAIFGIGCPSCLVMEEGDMVCGVKAAIDQKVDVISMSLALVLPAKFRKEERAEDILFTNFDQALDIETLRAFGYNILTVTSAGNMGEHGLESIAQSPPWCLSVASCTPKRTFITEVEFGADVNYDFKSIQGSSINMVSTSEWYILSQKGEICNSLCMMYLKDDVAVIERTSYFMDFPWATPVVYFTEKQSTLISEYLDIAFEGGGELHVWINSSSKVEVVDSPFVSYFSGRGPCNLYGDFMKPDISAPGEQIAAAWPRDAPLGSCGPSHFDIYNVQSGTSFAAPQVAAAAAILRSEMKFSASAICSALITTAKKMHGKEPIAYEYAYGAGMVDVKRAMRPGLVYEEHASSYKEFLKGKRSHYDLNLPYLSVSVPVGNETWGCLFKRKVKSIEVGKCIYKITTEIHSVKFDLRRSDVEIVPKPTALVFEDYGSEEVFTVSVKLRHTKVPSDSFGIISGSVKLINEENDELVVVSPLVISSKHVPSIFVTNPLCKILRSK